MPEIDDKLKLPGSTITLVIEFHPCDDHLPLWRGEYKFEGYTLLVQEESEKRSVHHALDEMIEDHARTRLRLAREG